MSDSIDNLDKRLRVAEAVSAGIIGGGAAFLGNVDPMLAICAGTLAPAITDRFSTIVRNRINRLNDALNAVNISLEELEHVSLNEEKLLLIEESISASLGTDHDLKVSMIVRFLKFGLDSNLDVEILMARRFARTVSRLDEIEFRCLVSLSVSNNQSLLLATLKEETNIDSADLIRSGMSVLSGEGLVKPGSGSLEQWAITDFGTRMVCELRKIYTK